MSELARGTRFGRYEIEEVAGRGGMGVVYRARQLRPQRTVALKVISSDFAKDPEFKARFERESELAASIEHPNVIPVYDVDEVDGLLYIAMRFVDGTDLRELILKQGQIAPRLAVQIVKEIGEALDAAHEKGLVHRDIKPANVLLAGRPDDPHPYLTDFGISKQMSEGGQTRSGMFVGTVDYIAPEQLNGLRVDARTDVYALGGVLYHALTGRVPYDHETDVAKMFAHASAAPPSPRQSDPAISVALDAVVRKGMAKDRAERYTTAGELGRAAELATLSTMEREQLTEPGQRVLGTDATSVAPGPQTGASPPSLDKEGTHGSAVPPLPGLSGSRPAAPQPGASASGPQTGHPAFAPGRPPQGPPTFSPPAGPTPAPARRRPKKGLLVGGGIGALLLVILLVALLAGGGGGDDRPTTVVETQATTQTGPSGPPLDRDAFQERVRQAVGPAIDAPLFRSPLPDSIPSSSRTQSRLASQLSISQGRFTTAVADLRALAPPQDVRDLHERTIDIYERLAGFLGEAAGFVRAEEAGRYQGTVVQISTQGQRLTPLQRDYGKRGYEKLAEE